MTSQPLSQARSGHGVACPKEVSMFTMAVGQGDDVDPLDAIATAIERVPGGARRARRHRPGSSSPRSTASTRRSWPPSPTAFPTATVMGTTSAAEISSIDGYQEDSITLAHVRVGQRGHHGRDGHGPRHRRRRGVPLGRRPGDGRDRARAEGLRRADRGVRERPPTHPRCDGPGAARGRDDGRGDIGGS